MTREFFDSMEHENEWRQRLQKNKEALIDSAIFLQLWSDGISRDPVACMQLGLCMMIDKPIHIVVPHGATLPENMRRVATSVEFYNPNEKGDVARVVELICKKNASHHRA